MTKDHGSCRDYGGRCVGGASRGHRSAGLYGLNAPKKTELLGSGVGGMVISPEELDIQLARLTEEEKDTFMRLLAKMQGRLIEAPSIEDQGVSTETTAVTVLPNGAGK